MKFNFEENFINFLDCSNNNDKYGMWSAAYEWYMNDEIIRTTELQSVSSMAFFTRVKIDGLNNMLYYFETIGDYTKAEDVYEIKEILKDSFRNMIKLLKINNYQLN